MVRTSKGAVIDDAVTSVKQDDHLLLVPAHQFFQQSESPKARGNYFTRVPIAAVHCRRMSPSAFRVYVALLRYVPWGNRNSDVWPSGETLARSLGVSRRTITRAIARLKELGFVEAALCGPRGDIPGYRVYVCIGGPAAEGIPDCRNCPSCSPEGLHSRSTETESSAASTEDSVASASATHSSLECIAKQRETAIENHEREKSSREVQQGCTSLSLLEALARLAFSKERAGELLSTHGHKQVAAALAACNGGRAVANRPGFVTHYLETHGFADVAAMKKYLHELPEPPPGKFHEHNLSIGSDLVKRFGSLARAREILELAKADYERLASSPEASEAQREIAMRASTGRYHEVRHALHLWEEDQACKGRKIPLEKLRVDYGKIIRT